MSHDGAAALLWSHLELDPFDEGYIDDEPDTCVMKLFVVPMPPDEVVEIEAEPPTIVGYPVPPLPGRGGAW